MKVWPKNETVRKTMRHPSVGPFRFPEGPEEWPDDSYTHRILQDGDVLTEDPATPVVPAKSSKEK